MITVTGVATLRVKYSVRLDMTEAEFDALSHKEQDYKIDNRVDWQTACKGADLDDIEVDEVKED